ncbi:hypothetical protein GOODEAATRI_000820 [Goodea atripinnis]|uniref:Integrator complex subunit 1 RPB2-binding domain-containing protein n=1 Tax=Goodea atripinnis TaxID=208336 RepID=A0ABV0NGH4_9TELE
MDNVSRNLLRLLTATCGYKEARLLAVQRLEMWLQNPKDLLMSLCMNCSTHGADDMEVISSLIKIRLKPKVLLNHYMLCVSDFTFLLLHLQFLAMVFQDLLTNKDDYLRASRALLREIIKQTKHEINFQSFCFGLMQERKEATYVDMEFKIASIQRDAVWWLHTVVPTISKVGAKDYVHCFFLRLCSEVPLLEDTLMRILVIGLSRDLPLGPADAMELADHLVKRAAAVQSDGV